MMRMDEELNRLHELINDLEKQNKFLKEQLDMLHRTYGCDAAKNAQGTQSVTLGNATIVQDVIL